LTEIKTAKTKPMIAIRIGETKIMRSERNPCFSLLLMFTCDRVRNMQRKNVKKWSFVLSFLPQTQHQLKPHLQCIVGQPAFFSTGTLQLGHCPKPFPMFTALKFFFWFSLQETDRCSAVLQLKQTFYLHSSHFCGSLEYFLPFIIPVQFGKGQKIFSSS